MRALAGAITLSLSAPAVAQPATQHWLAIVTLARPELHDTAN